jgi:acetyltransferase-like isoleucine patch superfamily enzyme
LAGVFLLSPSRRCWLRLPSQSATPLTILLILPALTLIGAAPHALVLLMSDPSQLLREKTEPRTQLPRKSPVHWFHAGFRAVDRLWINARSLTRLSWFKLLYPGLIIGRHVVIGRGVRFRVLNSATLRIGDRVQIDANAELHSDGFLSIGSDAYIGTGTIIVAADRIEIGNDALIAAYVTVRDQDHRSKRIDGLYRTQGLETSPIAVGTNVWIGTGAVVLKGVSIGDNCVIGANSVVTRSLPSDTRAAGVPARSLGGD